MKFLKLNDQVRVRAFDPADDFNRPLDLTMGNAGQEFEVQINFTVEEALQLADFINGQRDEWEEQILEQEQREKEASELDAESWADLTPEQQASVVQLNRGAPLEDK